MASSRAARSTTLGLDHETVVLWATSSSRPSVAGSTTSTPCGVTLSASSTETAADAAPVVLQVQERVADPGWDLVEQRGRDLGRPVDQDGDGITSNRASTSGTWRT